MACLLAACLMASACGSSGSDVSAEAVPADGPEYGATLEEWGRAIGAEREAAAGWSAERIALTAEYDLLDWDDLTAPGFAGEDVAAKYVEELASVADGSPEADAIYEKMLDEYDGAAVNTELDGDQIQLAGFVAPLTYDGDVVTEFLLVPYFGACIHVPPPPPHQTVLVTLDKESGLTVQDTWGAVWVAGTLDVSTSTTDLATASYVITDAVAGVHEDF